MLLQQDVIRAHFVMNMAPLKDPLNVRLPNINCHCPSQRSRPQLG